MNHVDPVRWMTLIYSAAFIRWTLQHPFRVAMARQRMTLEQLSAKAALGQLYRSHGLRGIFRGVGAAAAGNALGETIYIMLYEFMREGPNGSHGLLRYLPSCFTFNSVAADATAGFLSDAINVAAVNPFDVIATRQMTAGFGFAAMTVYQSAYRTSRSVLRHEGARGFTAGCLSNILYSPSSAMWWAIYNPLKRGMYALTEKPLRRFERSCPNLHAKIPKCVTSTDDNVILNALTGVTGSVVCTALFNPVLVVATRLQAGVVERPECAKRWWRRMPRFTILRCFHLLVVNEGVRGLFRGLNANLGMAFAEGIIFSQIYEITKLLAETKSD